MNVGLRKGDRRSGGRAGLAAEAGPGSRSLDLLTPDIGYLSLTLAADHGGCGAGLITQAWTPAPHIVGIDLHSVIHQLT